MLSEKILFRLSTRIAPLCIMLSVALFSPPVLYSAEERSYAREIQQYVAEDKVYLLENLQQNITRPSEKTVVEALLCESGPQAIELFQKQLRDYPDAALNQLSSSRIAAYNLALDSTAPLPKLSRPLPLAKPQVPGVQESTKQQIASIQSKAKLDIASLQPPLPVEQKPEAKPLPLPLKVTQKLESTPAPSSAQKKPKPEKTASPSPKKPKPGSTLARSAGYTLQFGLFSKQENALELTKKISLYEPAKIIVEGQVSRVVLKKNYATKQEVGAIMKKLPFVSCIVPARQRER
jgi:cell division protein FtsN